MEGMSSSPLALERKIRAESTDLLRPHHLFRNLVTIGSRVCSTHVSGRSAMARSHVRRGQIVRRYVGFQLLLPRERGLVCCS